MLTLEQAIQKVPAIGATAPAEIVSDKYSFLSSIRIIEDMNSLGWSLEDCKGIKSGNKNKYRKNFGKHFLIFQNEEVKIMKEDQTEAMVQIVFRNDMMGCGRLQIKVGIYRLICENGLVIAEKSIGNYAMRHMKYSYEDLQELVNRIVADLPKAIEKINTFSAREMTQEEMIKFASDALKLRSDEERIATPQEIADLLKPRRKEDEGNTLWLTFNRVQESICRGGTKYIDSKGKLRTMKAITNIMVAPKVNEQLWELAESYC